MKLHESDAVALVELWTGIKNYVPAKDQKQAAEQFIAILDESGLADLALASQEMYGIDASFDSALRNYCEENGYTNEDFESDWEE